MVKLTAQALPEPTHYTVALDDKTGVPMAVRAGNYADDEIAGPLPENWHPAFFDWRPRHDPNGGWLELADQRRDALWREAKAARAVEMAENVAVSIGGRKLVFQADAASREALRWEAEVARADPNWLGVNWITAGNASVFLDRDDLNLVIAAIGAAKREIRDRAEQARALIKNTNEPLLRSLGEVKAALPRT